jgi:hypothetical protein
MSEKTTSVSFFPYIHLFFVSGGNWTAGDGNGDGTHPRRSRDLQRAQRAIDPPRLGIALKKRRRHGPFILRLLVYFGVRLLDLSTSKDHAFELPQSLIDILTRNAVNISPKSVFI